MKPARIVCFSGHRQLDRPASASMGIHEALSRMAGKIRGAGQRTLFVSATHGSDFLCIDVATELEMPVHIILPKPVIESAPGKISLTEGFAGDFLYEQGNFLKREWNKALAFVRKAQSCADDWTYRIVNGSLIDPECYYDAGVKVIEAADVFLAVWDRQPARGLGDTAEMVDHA